MHSHIWRAGAGSRPSHSSTGRRDPPRSCRCGCGRGDADAEGLQNAAYEVAAAPFKRALLAHLVSGARSAAPATIVELGIGGFSTAAHYPRLAQQRSVVIGVEPDAAKHDAARDQARACGLSLRLVEAVAESLPLPSSRDDAVVSRRLAAHAPALALAPCEPAACSARETCTRARLCALKTGQWR